MRQHIDTQIRTLERDRQYIEVFMSQPVMEKFFEQSIRKAKDELITVYTFVQRGIFENLRYMKYALQNHMMKELERLLDKK